MVLTVLYAVCWTQRVKIMKHAPPTLNLCRNSRCFCFYQVHALTGFCCYFFENRLRFELQFAENALKRYRNLLNDPQLPFFNYYRVLEPSKSSPTEWFWLWQRQLSSVSVEMRVNYLTRPVKPGRESKWFDNVGAKFKKSVGIQKCSGKTPNEKFVASELYC